MRNIATIAMVLAGIYLSVAAENAHTAILALQSERGRWELLKADLDQFQRWYEMPKRISQR